MEELLRTEALIGKEEVEKLQTKKVLIVGVGGVGSYTLEALVRSGVGSIDIVDSDVVDITNINRQLIALHSTIGKLKVEVAKERMLDINPNLNIETFPIFYNDKELDLTKYDYIVDAIDSVKSKLNLIKNAKELNIPIISSMGTGNKLNPSLFLIEDISKTSVCPLARKMRYELRKMGINHLKVLYSKEEVVKKDNPFPSSISFTPSVAGLLIAREVILDLLRQ